MQRLILRVSDNLLDLAALRQLHYGVLLSDNVENASVSFAAGDDVYGQGNTVGIVRRLRDAQLGATAP